MTSVIVKTFAPVIIPTLCRYQHFVECLESLAHCTWANKTDVFIGLDYPANDSHRDGYNKIKIYLQKNKKNLNFKSLNIIERKFNYGLGKHGNLNELKKEVLTKYDRIIVSEDDNIFSPNFLVYMNKGLEIFQNDTSVLAINGYRHPYPLKYNNNTFIRENVDFSAWGYGIWKNRDEKAESLSINFFRKKFSLINFFKIYLDNGGNRALNFYDYAFRWNGLMSDSPLSIYAKLEKMDVIMPAAISLVRNMGWDNSGEHYLSNSNLQSIHSNQKISEKNDFIFNGTGFEYYTENRKIFKNYSYAKIPNKVFWRRCLKIIAKYFFLKFRLF